MQLSELISLPIPYHRPITGLSLDSRSVNCGDLFFALAGQHTHGAAYIEIALQKGAVAIVQEVSPDSDPNPTTEWLAQETPCVKIPNLNQRVGEIAARFYKFPAQHLTIMGVTGTNGKTSTTHFISQLLQKQEVVCGLIGTLGYGLYGQLQTATHTTPNPIQLQQQLAHFHSRSISHVAMEVSSHALDQGRTNGVTFSTAIFTNLSRDHLDYHGNMLEYGKAKQRLFMQPTLKTAIINQDDPFGQHLLGNLPTHVVPLTYSQEHSQSSVYARVLKRDQEGYHLKIHSLWGEGECHLPLLGKFNVSNVLGSLTTLLKLGYPFKQVLAHLSQLQAVQGRMERIIYPPYPTIVVDYAHTPDALQKTLSALRQHCTGQLWCIFGCGGERDRGKRPLMGQIAQQQADKVILTDDNPRHEHSQTIIDEIRKGCLHPTAIIPERAQAIRYAIQQANPNDLILIAGKGHENYQQIGDQKIPFSDSQFVKDLLSQFVASN